MHAKGTQRGWEDGKKADGRDLRGSGGQTLGGGPIGVEAGTSPGSLLDSPAAVG